MHCVHCMVQKREDASSTAIHIETLTMVITRVIKLYMDHNQKYKYTAKKIIAIHSSTRCCQEGNIITKQLFFFRENLRFQTLLPRSGILVVSVRHDTRAMKR